LEGETATSKERLASVSLLSLKSCEKTAVKYGFEDLSYVRLDLESSRIAGSLKVALGQLGCRRRFALEWRCRSNTCYA
jgi:hypothetical protein